METRIVKISDESFRIDEVADGFMKSGGFRRTPIERAWKALQR